jgi:small-conductance mechanosensitive channel
MTKARGREPGAGRDLFARLRGSLALATLVGIASVGLPRLTDDAEVAQYAPVAGFLAIGFLVVQVMLAVVFDGVLGRRGGVRSPRLLRDLVGLFVHLAVVAVVLKLTLGLEVGPLVTTSAVIGAVVGLALQETLGTLFAGVTLARERQILPGTWIQVDDLYGEVEEMNWRSVVLRQEDGHRVLLPNSELVGCRVVLAGRGTQQVAATATLRLPSDWEPAPIKEVLLRLASRLPGVEREPAPWIRVREIGCEEEGIRYEVSLFTRDPEHVDALVDAFLTAAPTALARELGRFRDEEPPGPSTESLSQSAVLAALPTVALHTLADSSRLLRFAPGECIVWQGEASRALYVLTRGEAQAERDGEVRARLTAGELFGEIGFLTGEPRSATVRAATLVEVVEVDARAMGELLASGEGVADELARRIAVYRERDAQHALRPDPGEDRPSWTEFLRRRILRFLPRRLASARATAEERAAPADEGAPAAEALQ